jgi:CPA2 family monovalent cation:H+ antiporter-2
VSTLFGDAANSEVMSHAGLGRARCLVVTLPEEASTEVIVAAARAQAPDLPIIARSTTESGTLQLAKLGARQVIHPELEGGLQIVRRTLLQLGFPLREVQRFADAVRRDYYDVGINTDAERQSLYDLLSASDNIGIAWLRLLPGSPIAGQTLSEGKLRQKTGASVVAIMRAGKLITNPEPQTLLQEGDLVGLVGDEEQIDVAQRMLSFSAGAND